MPTANMLDMFHGDNNERIPDFAALKAQGYKLVMHKVTEGASYRDGRFAERFKAAIAAGMPFGAYHFGTNEPVNDQITNLYNALAVVGATPKFLALDYEKRPPHTMSLNGAMAF